MSNISLDHLKIIGTSHIAKESVKQISDYMDSYPVDFVCVELDKKRFVALTDKNPAKGKSVNFGMLRKVGLTGFIFSLIATLSQKKLSEQVKTKAGSDMLSAINAAKNRSLPVALIDQDIQKTLKNISKKVRFKEKWRIISDLFKGLVGIKSPLTSGLENIDLKKVPSEELIEKVLKETKYRYPGLYSALVHDRNVSMSEKIIKFMEKFPENFFLVVVGAGHKDGLIEILEKKTSQKYKDVSRNSISYSYNSTQD